MNVTFSLIILCICVWSFSILMYSLSKDTIMAFKWVKLSNGISSLIPSIFLLFSWFFPKKDVKLDLRKCIVIFLPPLILIILGQFNLIASDVGYEGNEMQIRAGKLYTIFIGFFLLYFIFAFSNLIRKYKRIKGLGRLQIRYLFLGTFLSAIIAVLSNLVLPLLGESGFTNIGPFSTIILIGFTAYAIVKHRLMDIRVVISRSIIYVLLVFFVASMFTLVTVLTGMFFQNILGTNSFLVSLVVSILIVSFIDPIKHWLSKATDRIFFKAKIDYSKLLRQLSEIVATEIEIDALVEKLTRSLNSGLKIKNSILVLKDKDGIFRVRTLLHSHTKPLVFAANNPLIKYIDKEDKIVITEELQREIEDAAKEEEKKGLENLLHELEKVQAAAIAPVKTQEKLNAVLLLGPKLSGDVFNHEEINMIEVLTPQVASAIEKSKLYEEVKDFSKTLQKKVDEATRELSEQNRFLLALQKVTNMITRSLDFKKVTQNIVDSIRNELGYTGGLLLLIDEKKDIIYPEAVTRAKMTEMALKFLPKDMHAYSSKLSADTTIDSLTAKDGKIRIGRGFEEFVSPPVPKAACLAINKLLKIKSIVAVPIYSEDKIIGVIDFVLSKPAKEISKREIEMMKSLADQTGIVVRNLRLFEQIQKVNKDLAEANIRLKALDQAKTEFVSIASHQLRTPMTGIMGYLSMLTSGDFGKLKPEHNKILNDLLAESQRMIRLINQFLNVSKIEAGKFELQKREIQMEEVVAKLVGEIKKTAEEKGLKLIYNQPKKKLPLIKADPDKLSDVILNLIDNAIKYTPKGKITISLGEEAGNIKFSVKDTGIGIKPKDAENLFGKFQRASGIARIQPDGSGLGLFIAKSIIEGHRGKIWAESKGEGQGSTFYFTIPINK